MTLEITSRDKKLLFWLMIFCIVTVGGHFLILKPLNEQKLLKETYEQLTAQYQDMLYELSKKDLYIASIEEKTEQIELYKTQIIEEIAKEEVDGLITRLALEKGLQPTSLNLGTFSKRRGVLAIDVALNLNGTREQAANFLSALQGLSFCKVNQFSMGNEDTVSHQFQLTLYMMSQDLAGEKIDEAAKENK